MEGLVPSLLHVQWPFILKWDWIGSLVGKRGLAFSENDRTVWVREDDGLGDEIGEIFV